MKAEGRNALREYINSDSGKEFLQLLLNQEVQLKTSAWLKGTTTDEQIKLVNQEYGVYWVRSLIQDLVAVPKENPMTLNKSNGR